ncbi:trichohyalin [Reticulomyxa filosa]|uniref:Trichohyalin n=1 Tax=Reticulomyxa filosa TaxID=46433 RepID=X6N9H7_RETFI|nr:trichohyalin [Reticulomyxa filosa]|eukprot:ETO22940.1 trichohyalin [Reticulomyxa filosa]
MKKFKSSSLSPHKISEAHAHEDEDKTPRYMQPIRSTKHLSEKSAHSKTMEALPQRTESEAILGTNDQEKEMEKYVRVEARKIADLLKTYIVKAMTEDESKRALNRIENLKLQEQSKREKIIRLDQKKQEENTLRREETKKKEELKVEKMKLKKENETTHEIRYQEIKTNQLLERRSLEKQRRKELEMRRLKEVERQKQTKQERMLQRQRNSEKKFEYILKAKESKIKEENLQKRLRHAMKMQELENWKGQEKKIETTQEQQQLSNLKNITYDKAKKLALLKKKIEARQKREQVLQRKQKILESQREKARILAEKTQLLVKCKSKRLLSKFTFYFFLPQQHKKK